jgi:SAM-dependent methyltransferase
MSTKLPVVSSNPAAPLASAPLTPEETVAAVRERYAGIASGTMPSCCGALDAAGCAPAVPSTLVGYESEDLEALPAEADLGLGCGAPVARLAPLPGETILDLGSGPGLDALLAARKVGPTGRVIGVDMTPAMIGRARATAVEAGLGWVEFRQGRLESLPVDDATIDAVTSNCVINLVPDKAAVFHEVARVLRPGGRMVVSDIVLDGALPDVVARDLLAWAGCIAGAAPRASYFAMLEDAGLRDVRIFSDVDYLAKLKGLLPGELLERMRAAGVTPADLAGKVRSITYEARKPV